MRGGVGRAGTTGATGAAMADPIFGGINWRHVKAYVGILDGGGSAGLVGPVFTGPLFDQEGCRNYSPFVTVYSHNVL